MSLVDVYEVLVHVDELTNLELLRKGLYRVAVRAYVGELRGVPFACFAAPRRLNSYSRTIECEGSDQASESAFIDEAEGAYLSRSCYLRYIDERFDLGEGVHFRVEVPHSRPAAARGESDVKLVYTLLRADCGPIAEAPREGLEESSTGRAGAAAEHKRKGPWTVASTRTYNLGPVSEHGRHVYAPVVFDTLNLCLCGCTIHVALVTTKYAPSPSPLDELVHRVAVYKEQLAAWRHSSRIRIPTATGISATESDRSAHRPHSAFAGAAGSRPGSAVRWLAALAGFVEPERSAASANTIDMPPTPPSLTNSEEQALLQPHSFAEAVFERWRLRRARRRLAAATPPIPTTAAPSSSPVRSVRLTSGDGTPKLAPLPEVMVDELSLPEPVVPTTVYAGDSMELAPDEVDAAHEDIMSRLGRAYQGLMSYRALCCPSSTSEICPDLVPTSPTEIRAGEGAQLSGTRFPFGVRAYASRHHASWRIAKELTTPRGIESACDSQLCYDAAGRAITGPSGDSEGRAFAPFSMRCAPCLHDPEAVAVALSHEIEHAAAAIYGAWRAHVRLLTQHRYHVHLPLQALYRTFSLRVAQARAPSTWLSPDKHLDVFPNSTDTSPAAAASTVMKDMRLALPPACLPLLDAATVGVQKALELRVFRYTAHAHHASTSRSFRETASAHQLQHRFSDSEGDDDADHAVHWHTTAPKTGDSMQARRPSASKLASSKVASTASAPDEVIQRANTPSADALAAAVGGIDTSSRSAEGSSSSAGRVSPPPHVAGRSAIESGETGADSSQDVPASVKVPPAFVPPITADSTETAPTSQTTAAVTSIYDEVCHLADESVRRRSRRVHVVIFLNGLGGSTHDTRVLRSYLKLQHPVVYCFVTVTNQGKATDDDIVEISTRVAKEIHECLTSEVPADGFDVGKISFISFSLGGIVLRLALRHALLRPFWGQLHAFVSVASPHLGLLYSHSPLVSAGLFLFQKWRRSLSLSQLSFADAPTSGPESIRNCLLYLLACGWEDRVAHAGLTRGDEVLRRPASEQIFEPRAAAAPAAGTSAAEAAASMAPSSDATNPLRAMESEGTSITQFLHESPVHAPSSGATRAPEATGAPAAVDPSPVSSAGDGAVSQRALDALVRGGFAPVPNGAIMRKFRHIALLSSAQDAYAPHWSCAVQWCDAALADARHGGAYGEMLRGFFDGVPLHVLARWDIRFKNLSSIFQGKLSVDSVIGREAHVAFLETEELSSIVSLVLAEVWDI